jgi:signal transduction histidine kinase/ActR/RegA family two-component response regulator
MVSMTTALVLFPSIPKALAFRSPAELETLNSRLEREIVDRIEIEDQLLRAKQEAEAANRAKSLFLANMSHEVRTPMNAVIGYTDMLLEGQHEAEEQTKFLQTIRRNGDHLLRILDDILEMARIESGKISTEMTVVRIQEVMETVVSVMRAKALEKGLDFQVRYEGELEGAVLTDPTRLRQILMNIVGNAIKFTAAGRVSVTVRRARDSGSLPGKLQFEIADTGIGIPQSKLDQLFHPFEQLETTKRFEGTGLGLAISRKLAELLGGDISVNSQVGTGSMFTVAVEAVPVSTPTREPTSGSSAALGRRLEGVHVLVAEDYADNRDLVRLMLERFGMQVDCVENGREALERVTESMTRGARYDLILMDMQMPVMSGYEATRQIRKAGYRAPIIALTAYASKLDEEMCKDAGCDGFLPKPIDPIKLVSTLSREASLRH